MIENTVVETNYGYRRLQVKNDNNLVSYVKLLHLTDAEQLAFRLLGKRAGKVHIAPGQKRDYDYHKYLGLERNGDEIWSLRQ